MHHPVEVAVAKRKTHWSRGELRTLRAVAEQHERGLEFEGYPFFLLVRGGRWKTCKQLAKRGLLKGEICCMEDDRIVERLCYGFTDRGLEAARKLGLLDGSRL